MKNLMYLQNVVEAYVQFVSNHAILFILIFFLYVIFDSLAKVFVYRLFYKHKIAKIKKRQ